MKRLAHLAEFALLRLVAAILGALPRGLALACGAALGSLAMALGVRREVARANLALAFPDQEERWREHVLTGHYRELGRVAADYARLPALVHGPRERVFAAWRGEEHLHAGRAHGRGVVLLTGHFGHFELMGALTGRLMPVAFLVKPLSNPFVEAWLARLRIAAGVDLLPIGAGVRGALRRLRAGGAVAVLGDQDARKDGVFVPFLGRPASTPAGPAWLSLASGAPIVFGLCLRASDGRYEGRFLPPIVPEGSADDPRAIEALTRRHTALLEAAVREQPVSWFWLHRRWKTAPPPQANGEKERR